MSQTLIVTCCDAQYFDYTVTYKKQDGQISTYKVCNTCWNKSYQIKTDEITTKNIKIFQINISKIICNKCNVDVTKTLGCQTCHPEQFSNPQNSMGDQS